MYLLASYDWLPVLQGALSSGLPRGIYAEERVIRIIYAESESIRGARLIFTANTAQVCICSPALWIYGLCKLSEAKREGFVVMNNMSGVIL